MILTKYAYNTALLFCTADTKTGFFFHQMLYYHTAISQSLTTLIYSALLLPCHAYGDDCIHLVVTGFMLWTVTGSAERKSRCTQNSLLQCVAERKVVINTALISFTACLKKRPTFVLL